MKNEKNYTFWTPVTVLDEPVDFFISLLGAGKELHTDIKAYRPNCSKRVPGVIWQYTISGCGEVHAGGRSYSLPPGSGMLLTVPGNISYNICGATGFWEFFYINFSGEEAMRLAKSYTDKNGVKVEDSPEKELSRLTASVVENCLHNRYHSAFTATATAYKTLVEIIRTGLIANSSKNAFMSKVANYCLANMQQNISVEDMAAAANLSRWYFSRRFAEAAKVSPRDFLLGLRMDQAEKLLLNTSLSIKEISEKCGFATSSYFCRIFRKYHGASPVGFRKK